MAPLWLCRPNVTTTGGGSRLRLHTNRKCPIWLKTALFWTFSFWTIHSPTFSAFSQKKGLRTKIWALWICVAEDFSSYPWPRPPYVVLSTEKKRACSVQKIRILHESHLVFWNSEFRQRTDLYAKWCGYLSTIGSAWGMARNRKKALWRKAATKHPSRKQSRVTSFRTDCFR